MKLTKAGNLTGRNIVAAFIGVLGILGAQRELVWGNDLTVHETVYNTDFIAAAVGGLRNTTSAGINVSGISGTVNKAYLYWHGPMNSTNPLANAVIKVNGQTVTGVNIGYSDDNCWGFNNSQAYRADVTSLVRSMRNGTYILSQFVKQGTNVNANGASLLVFFNDSNPANNRDVVIFDGNDSNADNFYDAPGWNVTLAGINYDSGRGFIQLHVSDGQYYEDAAVMLNGMVIEPRGLVFQGKTVQAANEGPGGTGRLWDVMTYEVTSLLEDGTNSLSLTHGYLGRDHQPRGDCVSLIVAAINLPAGAAPPPPPSNLAPVVTGTPVITVNSPNPIVVRAQATDPDGDPLTGTIAIDGVVVSTNAIAAGSPATSGDLMITNAFGLGQHTVVFTANDGVASGSFTTVVNVIDNTPPVITIENFIVPSDLGRTTAVIDYRNRLSVVDDFPGVTWIADRLPGSAFAIGTTTVTLTAVDASGNRAQRSFTITVTDCLPPVINCPPDMLRATDPGQGNAVVRWTISANDNLPGCTVSCTPASGSVFQIGITTIVCPARDAAGNTATCMFTVTVVDREPPVLTVPSNIVVVTDPGQSNSVVNFTTTVTDNVPGAIVICTPPSGSSFPSGTNAVVCVATDAAGNHATNGFTITVIDREPPVITTPITLIVPADPGRSNAVVNYTVTVNDNVPGATIVCTPPAGSTFPLGSTPVSCVATDTTGNTATNGFTVVVEDREPPVIVVPANITVPNDPGLYSAVVNFAVSVTDNVPGTSVACVPASGSIFPVGARNVVCIASDAAGNKATNSFTVTVEDKEKPVLTLPAAISTVAEPGKADAVINFVVTATDNSGSATVTCAPPSGSAFPIGVTTVHCQATDAAGNTATGSFTVTIIDAELPVITGPGSTIVPTDPGTATAVVNYTVTVSDNAPGATVVCVPPSGSNFPLGVMTVTCTAMDTSGNQATTSFTVTVLDREPPTVSVPANIVVPNTPGQSTATVNYTATVHDNLPGATLVCTPPSGSAFTIGSTIVICIGTDTAGNKATNSFNVTVEDRESPTLNLPANIIRMVGPGQDTAVVDYTVSATDNSGSATVTCVPPSGSAFPVGVTIVTCTAKDGTGNTSSGSFTITVTTDNNGDDQPPVITVPPNLIVPTDPGQYSAVVNYTATVSDNQPGATLVCLPPPGTAFPAGSTTVTCIATDAAGNKATNSFTITVEDREKPVLTVPANFTRTVEPGQFGTAVDYLVTATDNSGSASVICLPASGAIFPLGLTMVTCTATDAVGNSATNAFMVMVIDTSIPDTQPPVITVPDNIVVSNDPGQSNAVVTYTVTVTDNLPGAMVMCVPPTGSTFPIGTTVVVCSAIDLAGNHSTNGFTVTVQDREKPVLNVPANITVVAEAGKLSAVIDYTATATDNSGSVAVVCVPPSGTAFPIGVTTVTCTAIDAAGNVATGSFTVTVISGTQPPGSCWVVPSKPVLCPTGKMIPVSLWLTQKDFKKKLKFSSVRIVSVTSNEPETGLSPDDIGPDWQIVDADKLKLKLRAERGDNGTGRIYTITVEAKDPKGNVSTCTATVTVPLQKTGKKAK